MKISFKTIPIQSKKFIRKLIRPKTLFFSSVVLALLAWSHLISLAYWTWWLCMYIRLMMPMS